MILNVKPTEQKKLISFVFHFQIESLDDNSGRLLIKLALGSTKDWFNEFMVQAVSKAEYAQYGKVLSKIFTFILTEYGTLNTFSITSQITLNTKNTRRSRKRRNDCTI